MNYDPNIKSGPTITPSWKLWEGATEMLFNRTTRTANGATRFALVTLREIKIGQLSIENVPAAVIENLDQSLLGMSFLKRLKSFEFREGELTINW